MKKRTFTTEFKRQITEELEQGKTRPMEICRKYNIAAPVIWRWKQQYAQGQLIDKTGEALPMQNRINELEKLVGRLTMDNELLKKALQQASSQSSKKEIFSAPMEISLQTLKRGARC